ncbi:DUF6356 family protein [Kiloniella laminariae]|uniref:DUF6356 family protein n=1 Tax=Kiloniella laminariae TaxID=454162 RepID=A0ABT4LMK1_9PROT|nr:DUF6356 family protein [Kiloniella laminariae]MCZ4282365.1 DUF6356 family protein [Kiloniella laminariae]
MTSLWSKLFITHPLSVHESYLEHMGQALYFSFYLGLGCFVCFCHALVPGAFEKTGSRLVEKLHDRMIKNRLRHQPVQEKSRTFSTLGIQNTPE